MKNLFVFISLIIPLLAYNQANPMTTAERSNYQTTSTYQDVMGFIGELAQNSKYVRLETIATSIEGRKIPLMVIGNPLPKSHEDMAQDDRIVVYLQGNIHAGEVEGKEATQMLARDLLINPESELLKHLVILINPILNADGNEKFSTENRRNQNGP